MDYSYQSLVGGPVQPPPQSLWGGLQAPNQAPPNNDPSMLAMMFAKQRALMGPQSVSREIDPGVTWGGRDRNAVLPDDFMRSSYLPPLPDNI